MKVLDNLTVSGTISKVGGTATQFLKADGSLDSSVYVTGTPWSGQYLPLAGGTLSGDLTTPKLLIGSGAFLTNSYFRIGQSVNAHIQGNINNTNAGTLASSDWVATANNGTDTSNFINFGINSSANADPAWTMAGANDGYLFTNGGHLTIGTASAAKDIKFFTGGTLAANEKMRMFGATGNFSLGNTVDNGYKLDVSGTGRFSGAVTASNLVGTGSRFVRADANGVLSAAANPTTLAGYGITDTISQVLTGYLSGAGTIAGSDSILQAIQKLDGNIASNGALSGGSNNYLTEWSGPNTVRKSAIYKNGSYYGINTLTAGNTLEIDSLVSNKSGLRFSKLKQSTLATTTLFYPSSSTQGIIYDATGNLYVAEGSNSKITKITPAGVVSQFGGSTIVGPFDLCFDTFENLYVSSGNSLNLTKITKDQVTTTVNIPGFNPIVNIKSDSFGNIYGISSGDTRIFKLTPAGVVSTFYTHTSVINQLCIDSSNNIYFTSTSNATITKLTSSAVMSSLGTVGAGAFGICMDASGNLYVANRTDNTVTKVTPGNVSAIFGIVGTEPYKLFSDTNNNLYVLNRGSRNVTRVSPAGDSITFGNIGLTSQFFLKTTLGEIYTTDVGGGISLVTQPKNNTLTVDLNGDVIKTTYLEDVRYLKYDESTSFSSVGSTHYIGTTSIANNRASASQILTGVSIDGNAANLTGLTTTVATLNNVNGINSGDNAVNSLYSSLVSNATHTGDATGATALTLATVNSNVGQYGSASSVPQVTVNAKGLTTAVSNVSIAIAESQVTGLVSDLSSKEAIANKDATGGYVGLTLFKINFKNVLNTFTSFFTNSNTASRTYTFPDKDGTVAMTSDITGINSGTNTGDNAVNSLYSGLVSNATHTGDATGSTALTVKGINGALLSGLATGILKNTTATGVPVIATVRTDYAEPTTTLATGILKNTTTTGAHSIAIAGDFPILNQNTTGTAGTITGSIAESQVTNLVTDLAGKEPSFSKNTAFNKNLGTSAGTVAEGNDSRILNGQTAYGWGNHAGLYRPIGYVPSWSEITSKPTTLSGFGISDGAKSLGTADFSASTTTATFLTDLSNKGFLTGGFTTGKGSWSYAGNSDISDTGFGAFELAGASLGVWNDGSNRTVLAIAPNTGTAAGQVLIYNDQGAGYSPGWRKVYTSNDFSSTNISNWNSAYGWGNPLGVYLPLAGGTMTGALTINSTLNVTGLISGNGKQIFNTGDAWLRINENSAFTGGTYFGTSIIRTDSELQVGGSGSTFRAHASVFTYLGNNILHAGNYSSYSTFSGAITGASLSVTGDVTAFSDARVKENIRPITNVIERIRSSRGVVYDRIDTKQKDNIGFIAQELEDTFPELVITQEDGTKAVKYQNAVAVLFEAVKEQQTQIEELKDLVTKLVKS